MEIGPSLKGAFPTNWGVVEGTRGRNRRYLVEKGGMDSANCLPWVWSRADRWRK